MIIITSVLLMILLANLTAERKLLKPNLAFIGLIGSLALQIIPLYKFNQLSTIAKLIGANNFESPLLLGRSFSPTGSLMLKPRSQHSPAIFWGARLESVRNGVIPDLGIKSRSWSPLPCILSDG